MRGPSTSVGMTEEGVGCGEFEESRAETLGRGVDSLVFVWAWDAGAGAGELWLGGAILAPSCSGKLLFRDFVHTSLFQKTNAE
jgi:hypothetical protein